MNGDLGLYPVKDDDIVFIDFNVVCMFVNDIVRQVMCSQATATDPH